MSADPDPQVEPLRADARARRSSAESPLGIGREAIPSLPDRPRSPAVAPSLRRSYPVGRQEFSRAYAGRVFEIAITSDIAVPDSLLLCLDTSLNAPEPERPTGLVFQRVDERTFRCHVTPDRRGLFWFRTRASADGGATWVADAAPDAWVMVDPPQLDGLRLYTLIPTASGRIPDWTDDLQRIRDLGFSGVHLLPLTRLDDSQSPYAARDLFDVDHAYLMDGARAESLDQLEAFVCRARDLGVALCFDLVLNHVGVHSTMARRAPAWIVPDQDSPDGNRRARYWADGSWRTWDDLVLVNYEHPSVVIRAEVWEYMTRYALFWARYAEETGGLVRLDNLHSSHPEFVRSVTQRLLRECPSLGTLAEYFTDDTTMLTNVPEWALNLVLATPWGFHFVPMLRRYLRDLHRLAGRIRYFMPITSHDSGSPAQEFGSAESTVPRYVASALLGTGSTGMPQGVEWGIAEKVPFIGIRPRLTHAGEPRFAHLIRSVNNLLAEHAAFRQGGNCTFVDREHQAIIAAFRRDPVDARRGFLVVCNFDTSAGQQVTCDLAGLVGPADRLAGREHLSGRDAVFAPHALRVELPPCGAAVWELRPA